MTTLKDIDFHQFVEGLTKTIELRDLYTSGHSKRVSELSELLAREMKLTEKECEYIHLAGHLHDIGKIGIPDGILLKTGRLSDAEFSVMQQHPVIGAEIFLNQKGLEKMAGIIRHHHERFDGKGYPDSLKGNEIPLGASIISVADSFDAMTTYRSYRSGIHPSDAVKEIILNRGTQFNPDIVDIFNKLYKKDPFKIISIISAHNSCSDSTVYTSFNSMKVEPANYHDSFIGEG
ncbi:MAG TPA: HD-GYP domain-containing protein [Spirochaetota bacterium]|nr:HD-GYP domain-containing protein [Spirochaetota bacterium]HPJ33400.1 HD-GYP domain-containing protein [Spirochaetota bacterium]